MREILLVCCGYRVWFLKPERQCEGRGVKEKEINRNMMYTTSGIGLSTESDDTMNEDTPVVFVSAVKEVVTPSVVDMTLEKEKRSCLDDTTVLESFPPLSTPVTTSAGNAPGKSSYANVTVESIRAISDRFTNTAYGFFLGKRVACLVVSNDDGLSAIATKLGTPLMLDSYTSDMCMKSWGMSSYARVMIELRADVELKDNIIMAMPRIKGENTGVGEKKTLKKPSQTSRGVSVSLKIGFKPQKECRHVSKKPTASSSNNKKKGVEPTIKVSNLNSFEVFNSVDNDMELHANANLVNNKATSSGSSFMNVDNSGTGTTLILEKIGKFEELLSSGQAILVNEAGNPLKMVEFSGDYESEYEVASVDNDLARSLDSKRVVCVAFCNSVGEEEWMLVAAISPNSPKHVPGIIAVNGENGKKTTRS
nr:hypothetical protein [Tanacetum cinerariifolium]